jgi:hypothetical protein
MTYQCEGKAIGRLEEVGEPLICDLLVANYDVFYGPLAGPVIKEGFCLGSEQNNTKGPVDTNRRNHETVLPNTRSRGPAKEL